MWGHDGHGEREQQREQRREQRDADDRGAGHDGRGPDQLNISTLVDRVKEGGVREVVLGLNATVEGQTTAHYVTDLIAGAGASVTRLAHGVPVGGELDYLDEGTLAAAFAARRAM